ncbi:MAG TPA: Crp/Fnr family transcriptional regulator [Patescibacteria group bacterium]|nr:Crp/Fnr family transcriptional regulator [Patescibacteria group bacterium]
MTIALPRPSLLLGEDGAHVSSGGNLLAALDDDEYAQLRRVSTLRQVKAGETVFLQGDHHTGIYIILSGQVRIYYTGPSGREITLAYWTPGNFVGGPEIFGGNPHMWSGQAVRPTELLQVSGTELRRLLDSRPRLALVLLEMLVHKGKCFSTLIQMLGTRSAAQRLAQLLTLTADLDGTQRDGAIFIGRSLSQEELAKMVGATRQWVSATLDRFREDGLLEFSPNKILIFDIERLRALGG